MLQGAWECKMPCQHTSFTSIRHIARSKTTDHMGTLFLTFWGNAILFSTVVVLIYTTNNSVQEIPLHTPSSALVQMRFCMPCWLAKMIIFSCMSCPFACLLLRNTYLGLWCIFKLSYWGSFGEPCVLWTSTLYHMNSLTHFLPFSRFSLQSVECLFWATEAF